MKKLNGFLLSSEWTDQRDPDGNSQNNRLRLWWSTTEGPVLLDIANESVCFVASHHRDALEKLIQTLGWSVRIQPVKLKNFQQQEVAACYLPEAMMSRWRQLLSEHNIVVWESDIKPADRFLMERFIYGSAELCIDDFSWYDAQRPLTEDKRRSFVHLNDAQLLPAVSQPDFTVWSIDIETSYPRPGQADRLFSISMVSADEKKVWMIADPHLPPTYEFPTQLETTSSDVSGTCDLYWYPDEISLLQAFTQALVAADPDILIGWNVIQFDMAFLMRKYREHQLSPSWGRDGSDMRLTPSYQYPDRLYCSIAGRVVLDGIECLRNATYHYDSFALDDVASQVLGDGKLLHGSERGGEIEALFSNDPLALAAYNLQDSQLVWDIFAKLDLYQFLIERSHITGLPMNRMGGAVAAFENQYLPRLHRLGYVAPNRGEGYSLQKSPGGFVMDSVPGLYQHVLVLDFKSLYPSIIRTFAVDPLALCTGMSGDDNGTPADYIDGFFGARFDPSRAILPGLIRQLAERRERAKRDDNQALSQAIKIIMASCYGVLGSEGCRFHDTRLSASITKRSHEIIQQSADWIRQQGFDVIYGDTDSVFVWLKRQVTPRQADDIGQQLTSGLNQYFRDSLWRQHQVTSYLEMEYETHYREFFMPSLRGAETGSKKRYAGLKVWQDIDTSNQTEEKTELVFKGLEAVRSDWTELAKQFQTELFHRYFHQQPYQQWLATFVADCQAGKSDDWLVYHKRLRRPVADYQHHQPPHVKAAARFDEHRRRLGLHPKFEDRGGWIDYVITVNGPEPLEYQQSRLDYGHYIEKQLMPIAEALFQFTDDDFRSLAGLQLSLF